MSNNKKQQQEGAENMILIPEGPFLMGSTKQDIEKLLEVDKNIGEDILGNEVPQRKVHLNAFYIDKYPATNAEYKKFIESDGYTRKDYWSDNGWKYISQTSPLESEELASILNTDDVDYPVVNVSWYEAEAFAKWAGKRLPSEAEWEKASRGTEGRTYPWGNEFDKTKLNCAEQKNEKTTPVSKYTDGQSVYGCFDIVGNTWEWTADWYDSQYYSNAPDKNPQGPTNAEETPYQGQPEDVGISIYDLRPSTGSNTLSVCKVIRGGSWNGSGIIHVRCANRDYDEPDYKNDTIGFRCVKSLE